MRKLCFLAFVTAWIAAATPSQALAAIRIDRIRFDPPGTDTTGKLNEEYVVIENTGTSSVSLTDWVLKDKAGHDYTFGSFRLGPGKGVYIHTGKGDDTRRHKYWGNGWFIWNNDGDTARLRRYTGTLADKCRYSGAGSTAAC